MRERARSYARFASDLMRLRPRIPQIINSLVCVKHLMLKRFGEAVTGYLPVSFGVFITFRCNLKCKFCYFDWDDGSISREDITLDEFKAVMEHPVFRGAVRVTFGGGEPLLHEDMLTFLDIAYKKHLYTVIYSNGLLLESRAEELARSRLNSLNVSIYDDFIERQLKNLSMLVEANKKNKNRMVVSLTRVISADAYEGIDKVLDSAKDIGVKNIFFQNYYSSDPEDSGKGIFDDDKEYERFLNQMKAKSRDYKLNVIFPNPLSRRDCGMMCISLYSTFSVNRKGDIAPCCFIVPPSSQYGNIFENSEPWNTNFFRRLRRGFIEETWPKNPKCRNCNLKTINSFKKVKFF